MQSGDNVRICLYLNEGIRDTHSSIKSKNRIRRLVQSMALPAQRWAASQRIHAAALSGPERTMSGSPGGN